MEGKNQLYEQLRGLKLENYKNSTEVIPGFSMQDILVACLIGKLNVFLIGETGEGKTQIENDILGLFGNNGFFEQGRNDLTIREMFTRFNLEKLRTAHTSEEVKELTELINYPVYVIDEITRCIPAVQNQFFNLFDGFITIDGRKYRLGAGNYSIGIASGNIGNGRYIGTSETDRALKDRMHLIIDIDYFPKAANDTLDILVGKKDPRVSDAKANDSSETIYCANEELQKGSPTLMQYMAVMYLVHGLDYLENIPGNSKRKNKDNWPGNVSEHDRGSDAALIFPFSMRSAISTLVLAQSLEMVKESMGERYQDSIEAVFNAAYLIGAQSGVLHPSAVDNLYDGNCYRAMEAVIQGIRGEFSRKEEALKQAIASAQKGKLAHLNDFDGRWSFMKDILQRASAEAKGG